ncbi:B2 bradykinin receptor [Monodelphis domestica]|uniref:B2 bradykinin receptor n=1 Tax=Monodelphis domestica TaxID=13616 RepID=UPI0024E20DB4|nr:B2 bradykinin receptor [Monodelphis domestica]
MEMLLDMASAKMINGTQEDLPLGINESLFNETKNSLCSPDEFWDSFNTIQTPFLWIIFVMITVENLFVLSVFCLHKSSCTVPEIYLGNLAAADLILGVCLPFWAINIASNYDWSFGLVLCKVVNSTMCMNLYSSIFFLMLVSIDRYLALVKTMSMGRMRGTCYAKFYSFIIWLFAIIMSCPMLIFRSLTNYDEEGHNVTICFLNYPSSKWAVFNNVLLNIVGFVLPLCVISFCTVKIIHVLQNNEMQKFKAIQREKKATILVQVVLLFFVICWLPFQVSTLMDTFYRLNFISDCQTKTTLDVFTQIGTYVGCSNSFLNPLVYVIVGKRFRKKSKEVYKRWFKIARCQSDSIQTENSLSTLKTSITVDRQINKIDRHLEGTE